MGVCLRKMEILDTFIGQSQNRNMSKLRLTFISSLLLSMLVLISFSCNTPQKESPPNFLFIFTDDQGYDDLSYHGNLYLQTPNIDQLACESVELTNFHAAPLCAPSRANLLTGRQFLRTGVWGVHVGHDYLNLDERTFAEVLQDNGYATGMMGKWHSGHTNAWQPWSRGFDHAWVGKLYQHGDCQLNYNGKEQHRGGWATDTLTRIAIDFMEENRNQPFFCYLPYMAPHGQWRAPQSYVDKYLEKGQTLELATVNAMIDHIDVNVGRLLAYLEESGLAENTIVFFTSDNGPVQKTHGAPPNDMSDADFEKRNPNSLRGSKGTVWENGTRVPFFVRWPGKYKPGVVDKNAALIDMFPTFLDIAGINIPADNKSLDGVSLKTLFEGDVSNWEDRLMFNSKDEPYWPEKVDRNTVLYDKSAIIYDNQILTVRSQDYKLVKRMDKYYLFHIKTDPREENDLIEKYPEIAEKMKAELKQWHQGIMNSESSYTMPRFLIGEEGVKETFLYTCAATSVTGNVSGGTLATSNWLVEGDAQTIKVEVLESGKYHLTLNAKPVNTSATVLVKVGDQTVSARLTQTNNLDLGTMDLAAGKYDLEIRIDEAAKSEEPVFKELKGIIVKWEE